MTDTRECGFMGCGNPQCAIMCVGVLPPAAQVFSLEFAAPVTVQTRGEFYKQAMQEMLFSDFHRLAVSADGDGWNEPYAEEYTCDCTLWEGLEWVQIDPNCSDRPSLDSIVAEWLQHVAESEMY